MKVSKVLDFNVYIPSLHFIIYTRNQINFMFVGPRYIIPGFLRSKKAIKFDKFSHLKFMFCKEAAKIDKIFTVDLKLCSKCEIDGEVFVNFCGHLRKNEL